MEIGTRKERVKTRIFGNEVFEEIKKSEVQVLKQDF